MGLIAKRSPFFKRTAKLHLKKNPKLKASYEDFEEFKSNNPRELYGGSRNDKPSPSGTLYKRRFPKMFHARLLGRDHSVWYEIVGNELRLYAILTHKESGTSPSSTPTQKSVVQKFNNATFEQQEKFAKQLKEADQGEWVSLTEADFQDLDEGCSMVDVLAKYFDE